MKLSILICSLESRLQLRGRLLDSLQLQMPLEGPAIKTPEVELMVETDNGEASIGQKRNRLLQRATGEYVCFVDDDDAVADDYVASILAALESQPDCVGFNLAYYVDGLERGTAVHSLRYQQYGQQKISKRLMLYERTPNHLNPIRRDIALQVGFPELNRGEDTDYAVRVRPLLNTEVFIDKTLYHYFYRSRK